MPPTSVHFNGSVNLPDTEAVMREISTRIPTGVHRMTDGETGERNYWIQFQLQKFRAMPEFEQVAVIHSYETEEEAPESPRLRLADGVSADLIAWPDLGYANAYVRSFETFARLQEAGTIAADVRFQMQYPTPLASIASAVVPEDLPAVVASYEAALFADLDRALAAIPHDRVAVQWDIAVEFGLLEGGFGPVVPLSEVVPGVVRCVDHVPVDVPTGLHLCYGDYGHQHFVQPESLANQVALLDAVTDGAARSVDWASFTVPQGRADAAYFAPLHDLRTGPDTALYFALVPYHPAQQPAGTTAEQTRLIDGALASSPTGARAWGICTECGMGRVAREDVPTLLDLHREILAGT